MGIRLKKNFTDFAGLFFIVIFVFAIAIFAVILYSAYNDNIKPTLNEALTSSTPVDANANVTAILDDTGSGLSKLNPLFPLLLIGAFGFVLVGALMYRSHPAFFFVGLVVLGVAIILAVTFSNVYEAFGDTDTYSATTAEFRVMSVFLENLPLVILIAFVAIAIILYALPKAPSGGAY